MKKTLIIAVTALLTACATLHPQPSVLSMANPASVYCVNQGGKLEIVKESAGEIGYCTLPHGERIEEWVLYRRNNK